MDFCFLFGVVGYLPYNQANEECRRQAKQQQLRVTEKLLQKYQRICEKKKVDLKVNCVESSSIQQAVVEQVSKLGISKLVVGSSSKSKLKRLLKGSKTAAIVAQNVPGFCAVMVVRNGRLSSVKDADHSLQSIGSSSFPSTNGSVSLYGTKDTLSEAGSHSIGSENSLGYLMSSARTDCSLPYWTLCTESGLKLNTGHKEFCTEEVESSHSLSNDSDQRLALRELCSASRDSIMLSSSGLGDSPTAAHCRSKPFSSQAMDTTLLNEQQLKPEELDVSWNFQGAQQASDSSKNLAWSVLHSAEGVLSEGSGSTKINNSRLLSGKELSCPFAKLCVEQHHPHSEASLYLETTPTPVCNASIVHEGNLLNDLADHEDLPKSKNGITNYYDLEMLKATLIKEVRDDLCVTLKVALKLSEEKSLQAVIEEREKCNELVTALSVAKAEAVSLRAEVDMAKQQAAIDRSSCREALTKVEDLKRELVREVELRKLAERRSWKSKKDLMQFLRKTQREYIEYGFEELESATNNFCEDGKLGEGGYGGVYKGVLNDVTVAIKVLRQAGKDGRQQFQHEVEVLSHIRHPHIVELLGACQERACIVYEYMENGSLEDRLNCKNGMPPLPWYVRFRICFEVAIALVFLHNLAPNPIVHRDLKPGNILLDGSFVSKLSDAGLARWIPKDLTYDHTVYRETMPAGTFAYMDPEYLRTGSFGPHSDVFALGIVILQILTGRQPVGVVNLVEAAIEEHRIHEVLDPLAGEWPLPEAEELAKLGLLCAEPRRRDRPNLETHVLAVLRKICEMAHNAVAITSFDGFQHGVIRSSYFCPLSQEIMKNPHIAADGFTYEFVAIREWLAQHDISPMTNLKLDHKQLTKDCSLESKIQVWKQELSWQQTPFAKLS
ncbi:hypothetical protein GOP47_0016634 [Adiantum capillus-veneris]|uniref:RING-type E3 ubiquitin transferase n=1 Tax=Adiantum capillus-veneris TaxID=13818 RepID=A0A9D4ZAX0_ADICA|nr:hypothetical protein GOP47_0016634 [Adiantum capillus-veneris]